MGLDPAAEPRNKWAVIPADDKKGPLEVNVSKADVGRFLLCEALTPTARAADMQVGWKPAPKKKA